MIQVLANRRTNSIKYYEFDAVISDSISLSSSVTEYPIESGVNVSDHIRNEPIKISMEVISTGIGEGSTNPDSAFYDMYDLWRSRAELEVYQRTTYSTGSQSIGSNRRVWPAMVITSIEIPRDSGTGQSVRMTINLQEIKKARVETTEIPAESIKKKAGKKQQQNSKPIESVDPNAPVQGPKTLEQTLNDTFGVGR